MRKAPVTIVILALVTPVLGGCQSFIGRALGFSKDHAEELQAAKTDYAEAQMALGRAGLDAGQYGQAIVAFRNARTFPEHSAGASNGLAVAYLQLGRPDLAERFFKEAIVLDPGNRKYQANLNRFYEAVPQVALKTTREEAPALASLTPQPQTAAQAPAQAMANVSQISSVSFQQTPGRMQRVSANEVVIGARPAVAVAAPDGRRRAATAAAAPAAIVQDRRRRNPGYPVRVGIGAAPATATAAYPVRLGLAARPATITVTRSDGTLVSSGPVKRR